MNKRGNKQGGGRRMDKDGLNSPALPCLAFPGPVSNVQCEIISILGLVRLTAFNPIQSNPI